MGKLVAKKKGTNKYKDGQEVKLNNSGMVGKVSFNKDGLYHVKFKDGSDGEFSENEISAIGDSTIQDSKYLGKTIKKDFGSLNSVKGLKDDETYDIRVEDRKVGGVVSAGQDGFIINIYNSKNELVGNIGSHPSKTGAEGMIKNHLGAPIKDSTELDVNDGYKVGQTLTVKLQGDPVKAKITGKNKAGYILQVLREDGSLLKPSKDNEYIRTAKELDEIKDGAPEPNKGGISQLGTGKMIAKKKTKVNDDWMTEQIENYLNKYPKAGFKTTYKTELGKKELIGTIARSTGLRTSFVEDYLTKKFDSTKVNDAMTAQEELFNVKMTQEERNSVITTINTEHSLNLPLGTEQLSLLRVQINTKIAGTNKEVDPSDYLVEFIERLEQECDSISLQQLEKHVYSNDKDIKKNMKTYGFTVKTIKDIDNYIDLANILGIDSRDLKTVDLETYVSTVFELLNDKDVSGVVELQLEYNRCLKAYNEKQCAETLEDLNEVETALGRQLTENKDIEVEEIAMDSEVTYDSVQFKVVGLFGTKVVLSDGVRTEVVEKVVLKQNLSDASNTGDITKLKQNIGDSVKAFVDYCVTNKQGGLLSAGISEELKKVLDAKTLQLVKDKL